MDKKADLCTYTHLPNGIHEIVLGKSSSEAVDCWFQIMDQLYSVATPNDTLLLLIDFSAGMQPITYTFRQARQLLGRYQARPATRSAMMHSRDFVVPLVQTMLKPLLSRQRDVFQFFAPKDRENAIKWLLEGINTTEVNKVS